MKDVYLLIRNMCLKSEKVEELREDLEEIRECLDEEIEECRVIEFFIAIISQIFSSFAIND